MKDVDIKKLKNTAMKLEDLMWSLKKLRVESIQDALDVIKDNIYESNNRNSVNASKASNDDEPNKHYLIGVMPKLLQNKDLFPQNEDIYDFAISALEINITRFEKRSRYEIIGMIVCATCDLGDKKLSRLVKALESIIDNSDEIKNVVYQKQLNSFSWNEAIQKWYNKI